ncbi:hypothetical protein T484DRAFT_2243822 [Baffinella frigidus]|nr:hypothetical protein T484DRAFT_2243822 [Cryptophyta sp. CCMP2293]
MFPGHGGAANTHVPPGSVPSGARPPPREISGSGGAPDHLTPGDDDRDFSATPHTRRVERVRSVAHSMSPEEESMDLDPEPQQKSLVFHRVDGARAETCSPSPGADLFRAPHHTSSIPDPRGPPAQVASSAAGEAEADPGLDNSEQGVFLGLFCLSGALGCAVMNESSAELSLLQVQDAPDYETLRMLIYQLRPAIVITNAHCDQARRGLLRGLCWLRA